MNLYPSVYLYECPLPAH